jgi:hypothetical protein
MLPENKDNLFGVLTGDEVKYTVSAFKGHKTEYGVDVGDALKVKKASAWRVFNWDDDEVGGPGFLFWAQILTPKGKPILVQLVVPKDEMIKALALLVEKKD